MKHVMILLGIVLMFLVFVSCAKIESNVALGVVVENNTVKIQFSLTSQPKIVMLVDTVTGERAKMQKGENNIYSAVLPNPTNEWFIEVWFNNGEHKIYSK